MIIIKRNEKDTIDRMLKKYRQKLKKTKQIREIRNRKEYTKPYTTKRLQKQRAVYVQKLRDDEQNNSN